MIFSLSFGCPGLEQKADIIERHIALHRLTSLPNSWVSTAFLVEFKPISLVFLVVTINCINMTQRLTNRDNGGD